MRKYLLSTQESPERPADPALRRANLRRIGNLFAPYHRRLGGLLLLIVASAALGVVPAFLLKSVLEAIARAHALFVLTLEGDRVSAITWFGDKSVFPHFGLPRTLRD